MNGKTWVYKRIAGFTIQSMPVTGKNFEDFLYTNTEWFGNKCYSIRGSFSLNTETGVRGEIAV